MSKPFSLPGTAPRYTPDRPVVALHLRIDLELDFDRHRVTGTSTLRLKVRREGLQRIKVDAVAMTIGAVLVDGKPAAAVSNDGYCLHIELGGGPRRRGEVFTVEIPYACEPRRGLYFIGATPSDPQRTPQCWTQGQDEDARHFFPCLDGPADKATSELICVAPRDMFVLSNGDLRERTALEGQRDRWHYNLDVPHASYLVTLVAGTFAEVADRTTAGGVEIRYFVQPGREDDARRTLGRTPDMIDFFSRRIGVPYPFGRYSQIVVSDFIFGGMENTTATTLTDQCLLDARAARDLDYEALVAHELAHQWWGDLLTCREWPEAWLNEGFATYFEYVWREHAHGRDEADAEQLADIEAYLNESDKYQRPIVCRHYEAPIEIFDAHLYDKGGRVLHMLRHQLGDDAFFAGLRLYAERHARGSVETRDLMNALEEVSGQGLHEFFDQWIRSPGHIELAGSVSFNPENGVVTVRVEQKQPGDNAFAFSTIVRIEVGGQWRDEKISVRRRSESFDFTLSEAPTQVIFDPGGVILKRGVLEKSMPLWIRQLEGAVLAVDRIEAARALSDKPEPRVIDALAKALAKDPFWAVRAAAASSLGKIRSTRALEALLPAIAQESGKVRKAVAAALGEFKDDRRAGEALLTWVQSGDPSPFVEGESARSLGRIRAPGALGLLERQLDRPSFQDVVAKGALDGLAALGDEAAWNVLVGRLELRHSFHVRRTAATGLARLSEGTLLARRTRERLESALDDPDFRVRMDAAGALAQLGDGRATTALDRAAQRELDGRARRRFRLAIAALQESGARPEQMRKLGDEVERLRAEVLKLRDRMERIEAQGSSGPAAAGSAGAGGRRQPARTRRGGRARRRPRQT